MPSLRGALAALALVTACGDPTPAFVDGGALDAHDPDGADQPDAATGGLVSLTAYDWRGGRRPAAGADVLFLTATGDVTARTTTDAAGQASGVVPGGGSVLVVDRDNNLTSVLGVEAGDQLVVGSTTVANTPMNGTVIVPAGPAGTTRYFVTGPCASGSSMTTTITVAINTACPAGPRDLLAVAVAGTTRQGYLPAPAAAVAPATSITLTGPWSVPATFTASFGGVTASMTSVRLTHVAMAGPHRLSGDLDTLPAAVAGATSASFPHAPPIGDGTLVMTLVGTAGGEFHRHSTYHAGRVTSLTMPDVGAELLPSVSNLAAGFEGASWTIGAGRAHDGVTVTLEALDKGNSSATWRVVAPAGTTSVELPTLPTDLEGRWQPVDGVGASVTLIESHVAPGREFRETALTTATSEVAGTAPNTVRTSSFSSEQ